MRKTDTNAPSAQKQKITNRSKAKKRQKTFSSYTRAAYAMRKTRSKKTA
jgi:hypothetical protein